MKSYNFVLKSNIPTVIEKINQARTKYGLTSVVLNPLEGDMILSDHILRMKMNLEEVRKKAGATTTTTTDIIGFEKGSIVKVELMTMLYEKSVAVYNYCSCDCNYCSCNCNYCSCNCNYCSCDCNYCSCDCDYCSCDCDVCPCKNLSCVHCGGHGSEDCGSGGGW